MRVLIASDDESVTQCVMDTLAREIAEDGTAHVVRVELSPDRAARLAPDLLILILAENTAPGLEAMRETRATVPRVHILVVGPASNPKMILRTLHAGADEYLDAAILENELAEALARYRVKYATREEEREPGRIIAVLSPSGGSGSSTTAVNLASILAKRGGECGLMDFRLQAGDLPALLDLRPVHTMADLCDRLTQLDQVMFEQFMVKHPSGVSLLAAPENLEDVKKITSRVVRRILMLARRRFPYVVMDIDNAYDSEQLEALWQADVILLMLRLDYTSLRNARRILDSLVASGIGLERVDLVVNGYRQSHQLRARQIEDALEMKVRHYIPHDPARVNQAVNTGVPVVLKRPSAPISKSFANLATSVNGWCAHGCSVAATS